MTREERARYLFNNSYNCAQAVAIAFSADTSIDETTSCRMTTAFGAGGGRRQFCCGAVSGALLVISLLKGREFGEPKSVQDTSYALARGLFSRFESLHGSSKCRVLLDGIDLQTEQGQERFVSEGMSRRCEDFVADTVRILEDILEI